MDPYIPDDFTRDLPQQRIYPVKEMPEIKPEFYYCCSSENVTLNKRLCPPKIPNSARFLGSVLWAWVPMHVRFDGYYISTNRQRRHWILWRSRKIFAENSKPNAWERRRVGHCLRHMFPEQIAAGCLLASCWQFERRKSKLTPFHWVNQEGFFSVAHFMAIARGVWGVAAVEEVARVHLSQKRKGGKDGADLSVHQ